MTENHLFQFAQVIAELPIQNMTPNNTNTQQQQHQTPPPSHRYLRIRKNACVVCSICFTCSKYYGIDCTCQEIQPRRGKNLPQGGLDSRAKKLHKSGGCTAEEDQEDNDDYEFSIGWINKNAHELYKDDQNQVVGLRDLSEVSLCKAHSSTLYRAKKRHERQLEGNNNLLVHSGGLAAKVRELSSPTSSTFVFGSSRFQQQQQQQQQQQPTIMNMPDFNRMSYSTSNKRKRTSPSSISTKIKQQQENSSRPNSSISTPLLYTSSTSFSTRPPLPPVPTASSFLQPQQQQQQQQPDFNQIMHQQQQQQIVDTTTTTITNFPPSSSLSHQLPPLHSHTQQQPLIYPTTTVTTKTRPHTPIATKPPSTTVIETVSLKSSTDANYYYFRNLAITDTFTFRDLLQEIDMTGTPPIGKRIVISDNQVFYPLDEAIRNVIKRPVSTHLDLMLGLTDKPSINWSQYS